MTLKEAFRYQNFLNSILREARTYLTNANNFMIVYKEHMRSKAVASANDETEDNLADRVIRVKPDIVIAFIMQVLSEKETLSKAINNAKIQHCPEMDMRIALNKSRQEIVDVLNWMVRNKPSGKIVRGCDYTINAEGNQTEYYYNIKQTSKADYDRFNVKQIISKMSAESDKTSATIDYWVTSIPVEHIPAFDYNDSFEELVEMYAQKVE